MKVTRVGGPTMLVELLGWRILIDPAFDPGGVRFGITGPLTYTMTGHDAVRLIGELRPRVALPAHYDGWSHFRDGEHGMRAAVAAAPAHIRDRTRWLPDGIPVAV